MNKQLKKTAKILSVTLLMGFVSACNAVGGAGSPQQLAQARAVHAFDENRAPFGQRVVNASSYYKPQVRGLNPYFGR